MSKSRFNSDIKISVIVPAYNVAPYLHESIGSVLTQILREIEIVCVDDGSTDDTGRILDEYALCDGRVRVIHQPNSGVAMARNNAIVKARGEYLAFLDPDDLLADDTALSRLYRAAKEHDADIVGGGLSRFLSSGKPYRNGVSAFDQEKWITFDDYQFDYGFYRFIYRRSLIESSSLRFPSLTWYEDPIFFAEAAIAADGFWAIPGIVYRYRKGDKTVDWRANDFRKVQDLITGLSLQLRFARKHKFNKLEEHLYLRRTNDFRKALDDCSEASPKVRQMVAELDAAFKCRDARDADTPKVTVIVPSLNSIAYYRECLSSVVSQTLHELEILCVDAGSTDGTCDVIREYAERDGRIRLLHSDVKSYGYQVNLGIREAQGEYVGIVEADDYVAPQMMKRLYAIAAEHQLDFVKSNLVRFTRKNGVQDSRPAPISRDPALYGKVLDSSMNPALMECLMNTYTGIYSCKFLRENNILLNETPGASYQDNGFWFKTFVKGKRIYFLDEAFYHLRRDNPNSSVKSKGKVYCMNVEYAHIRAWLDMQDRETRDRFATRFVYEKFKAYNFTFTRISDGMKFEYGMCMFGVFKEAENAGLLDRALFDSYSRNCLDTLLKDPLGFVYRAQSQAQRRQQRQILDRVAGHFMSINPVSKGIVPRMLQCYRENGLVYTVKRVFLGKQH